MTRNWTGPAMLAAVIVLALTPVLFAADAAPAAGAGATTQPIEVKQSTPKDLVETDILASERMDFDVLLRIIAPDYKDAAKLMVNTLTKTTQLGDRLAKLGDAMEEPFGKDAAEAMRTQAKALSPENFKKMVNKENVAVFQDGKIAWDKITLEEKGDKATANWTGREHPANMVKIDGKWYSLPNDDFGKTPEEAKAKIQKVLDTFDKGIARLDDVIAKLNAGKMTEQEFGAAMEEFGKGVQEIK